MSVELPSTRLASALPPHSLTDTLQTKGYAVVENSFGKEWCETIREEMDVLHSSLLFTQSGNVLAAEKEGDLIKYPVDKPGIFELDMVFDGKVFCKPECFQLAPNISHLFLKEMPKLVEMFNAAYPELDLSHLDQMKLQINEGDGACFPMHFDTSTAVSKRHLTAVLYLNPDWKPEHGGHIRVYPLYDAFLCSQLKLFFGAGQFSPYDTEDLAPINDRLILFCSTQMLHRVQPSFAPRYCFSLWFASKTNKPFPYKMRPISAEQGLVNVTEAQQLLSFLFENNKRRMLSKIIYAQEWDESCREAFGNPSQREQVMAAMELHWKEVERLEGILDPDMLSLLKTLLPLKDE